VKAVKLREKSRIKTKEAAKGRRRGMEIKKETRGCVKRSEERREPRAERGGRGFIISDVLVRME
jgi:hypothetical protein